MKIECINCGNPLELDDWVAIFCQKCETLNYITDKTFKKYISYLKKKFSDLMKKEKSIKNNMNKKEKEFFDNKLNILEFKLNNFLIFSKEQRKEFKEINPKYCDEKFKNVIVGEK